MSRDGRELVWLTVYFVTGMLVGWGLSEATQRLGVPDGWTLAGVLVLGGFYVWLARRPRYQSWLAGTDKPDDGERVEQPDPPDQAPVDDPDIWWTTEDVGDARTPRGVKP